MTALRSTLWDHQQTGLDFVSARNGSMLAFDMGTGKTLTTIARIAQMPPGSSVLILCPKAVIPVWPREFAKHLNRKAWPYSILSLIKGGGKKKAGQIMALFEMVPPAISKVVVVNYETAISSAMAPTLLGQTWDLVVMDESHKIKSGTGKASKFCSNLTSRQRIGLTGTPMPHSPLDIFGQARAIDSSIFGTSFVRFRNRYAVFGIKIPPNLPDAWKMLLERLPDKHRAIAIELVETRKFRSAFREDMARAMKNWLDGGCPVSKNQWNALLRGRPMEHLRKVIGWRNMSEFETKLAQLAIQVKARDVLDMPPDLNVEIPVILDAAEERAYKAMEKHLVAELDSGTIGATNALDRLLKLAQITGGSCKDEDGTVVEIGSSKREALQEILSDLPNEEPVVVFARFRSDLDSIHQACSEVDRESLELSGKANNLKEWSNGKANVIAVQIQAGGSGIDLTRACKGIYYSVSFSLGDYDQSRARILRPGQDRPVTYFHLAAEGTIDQRIYNLLDKRRALVSGVLEAIRFGARDA